MSEGVALGVGTVEEVLFTRLFLFERQLDYRIISSGVFAVKQIFPSPGTSPFPFDQAVPFP